MIEQGDMRERRSRPHLAIEMVSQLFDKASISQNRAMQTKILQNLFGKNFNLCWEKLANTNMLKVDKNT